MVKWREVSRLPKAPCSRCYLQKVKWPVVTVEEVKEKEEEVELCPSRDEPHARPVTTTAHSGALVLPIVLSASQKKTQRSFELINNNSLQIVCFHKRRDSLALLVSLLRHANSFPPDRKLYLQPVLFNAACQTLKKFFQ